MTIAEDFLMGPPNWRRAPVTVFGFTTHKRRSIDGYEARNALLTYPIRKQQYTIDFQSSDEKNYLMGKLYAGVHKIWGVPLWGFGSVLTSEASSGQPVLQVDTTSSFFADGQTVCLFDAYNNYELETIVSSTASAITLSGNLVSTWAAGTEVYPILQGYIRSKLLLPLRSSIYGGVAIQQRESYDDAITRLLGSHSFGSHRGYDVFNKEPNWVSGMRFHIQRDVTTFKTLAIEYTKTYQTESDLTLEFDHLLFSRAELYDMVGFFNSKLGEWKQFWIPTWTKDVVVTAAIGASDTTLTIEDIDYEDKWSGNVTTGKWLYFLLTNGTEVIREVTGWPSDTELEIDSALGVAVSAEELPYMVCSFLIASRFNSDELEVAHRTTQVSEITLNTLSLAEDPMLTTTTT
jgi:hypothetical protein